MAGDRQDSSAASKTGSRRSPPGRHADSVAAAGRRPFQPPSRGDHPPDHRRRPGAPPLGHPAGPLSPDLRHGLRPARASSPRDGSWSARRWRSSRWWSYSPPMSPGLERAMAFLPLHLLAFFLTALVCHRRLAEERPATGPSVALLPDASPPAVCLGGSSTPWRRRFSSGRFLEYPLGDGGRLPAASGPGVGRPGKHAWSADLIAPVALMAAVDRGRALAAP